MDREVCIHNRIDDGRCEECTIPKFAVGKVVAALNSDGSVFKYGRIGEIKMIKKVGRWSWCYRLRTITYGWWEESSLRNLDASESD